MHVFLAQAGLPADSSIADSEKATATAIPPSQKQRRPGPEKPRHGIPPAHWPDVLHRIEQGDTLRQIAQDYSVSHETVRRTAKAAHKRARGEK